METIHEERWKTLCVLEHGEYQMHESDDEVQERAAPPPAFPPLTQNTFEDELALLWEDMLNWDCGHCIPPPKSKPE